MSYVRNVFFLYSGVIITPIIYSFINSKEFKSKNNIKPLIELETDLIIERISIEEFLKKIHEIYGLDEKMANRILSANLRISENIINIIKKVSIKNNIFIFKNYPEELYTNNDDIYKIEKIISTKNIIKLTKSKKNIKSFTDFNRYVCDYSKSLNNVIWIDHNYKTVSFMLKNGINSIFYTSENHLLRELTIRRIIE